MESSLKFFLAIAFVPFLFIWEFKLWREGKNKNLYDLGESNFYPKIVSMILGRCHGRVEKHILKNTENYTTQLLGSLNLGICKLEQ